MENIILFADSNRGIYIPQHFAESINREYVSGIDSEQWQVLESGPEHDSYWDVWDEVIDSAVISKDGREYAVHQDGDLWLVDYDNVSDEERESMFGSF